jgi:hypothetical protein
MQVNGNALHTRMGHGVDANVIKWHLQGRRMGAEGGDVPQFSPNSTGVTTFLS